MRRSHQRELCPVAAKRKAWNLDVERMASLRGPRVRLQGSLPTVFIRLCRSMWDGDLVHAVRAVSTRLAACYTQHCRFQNFYPYQRGTRFRGVQTMPMGLVQGAGVRTFASMCRRVLSGCGQVYFGDEQLLVHFASVVDMALWSAGGPGDLMIQVCVQCLQGSII